MKFHKLLLILVLVLFSCKNTNQNIKNPTPTETKQSDFVIAFGSCNNQILPNFLWKEIEKNKPNVWIWGGDIIYSDTYDMEYLKKNYEIQKNNTSYANFIKNTEVLGTWDDHDYGLNDGGAEYSKKEESQQLFLDFFDVPKNSPRRLQKGIYFSKDYKINSQTIKIIVLDTRYFRSELTKSSDKKKRYKAALSNNGTILGEEQWNWLTNELNHSKATFNVIISSIQFLSSEHGFECWNTMPNEIEKMENLLKTTGANNVLFLSGDRHISEFSKKEINGLNYPIIDFTSSGLTHSYSNFTSEENKYRIGQVVSSKSFGLLNFDLKNNVVLFEIRGENNKVLQTISQKYN